MRLLIGRPHLLPIQGAKRQEIKFIRFPVCAQTVWRTATKFSKFFKITHVGERQLLVGRRKLPIARRRDNMGQISGTLYRCTHTISQILHGNQSGGIGKFRVDQPKTKGRVPIDQKLGLV